MGETSEHDFAVAFQVEDSSFAPTSVKFGIGVAILNLEKFIVEEVGKSLIGFIRKAPFQISADNRIPAETVISEFSISEPFGDIMCQIGKLSIAFPNANGKTACVHVRLFNAPLVDGNPVPSARTTRADYLAEQMLSILEIREGDAKLGLGFGAVKPICAISNIQVLPIRAGLQGPQMLAKK